MSEIADDTALLFMGNAVGFHQAATRMAAAGVDRTFPWPPFFACLGYALELSLKAYVIQRGGSSHDCQQGIRHDLSKAVLQARARGLTGPSDAALDLISRVGRYHKDHSFRYLKPIDVGQLPQVDEALAITEQLLHEIADQLPELQPQ